MQERASCSSACQRQGEEKKCLALLSAASLLLSLLSSHCRTFYSSHSDPHTTVLSIILSEIKNASEPLFTLVSKRRQRVRQVVIKVCICI